jgi:hypothetical protein
MYVSFLYPYRFRSTEAPHLWVFYHQLGKFRSDEIAFIGTEDYFRDPACFKNRWETSADTPFYEFMPPEPSRVQAARKYIVPYQIFTELESLHDSYVDTWKYLLTQRYDKLELILDEIICDILKSHTIEAILAWYNTPSLDAIASRHGIKVIHYEFGTFRKPFYLTHTAFFDFSGTLRHTEAADRFCRFKQEICRQLPILLTKTEILNLFLSPEFLGYANQSSPDKAEFEIGLALQVEDTISITNNLSNLDLIHTAVAHFGRSQVLARRHRDCFDKYDDSLCTIDTSPNQLEFIRKCKQIATFHSNLALESILLNRTTYTFEQTPLNIVTQNGFAFSEKPVEDELLRVNFLVFAYLVPYELMYDRQYLQWRLSQPSESDIYERHLQYYLNLIGADSQADLSAHYVHSMINTRAKALSSAASALTQLFREVYDRDRYIRELTGIVESRDSIIKSRDEIIRDRDTYIGELDQIVATRDTIIRDRDSHIDKLLSEQTHLSTQIRETEKLRIQLSERARQLVIQSFDDKSFDLKLKEFLSGMGSSSICLYGAGIIANEFINRYDLSALNILGIIDRDPVKAGHKIGKYLIYPPDALISLKPDLLLLTVVPKETAMPFVSALVAQYALTTTIKSDLFF